MFNDYRDGEDNEELNEELYDDGYNDAFYAGHFSSGSVSNDSGVQRSGVHAECNRCDDGSNDYHCMGHVENSIYDNRRNIFGGLFGVNDV